MKLLNKADIIAAYWRFVGYFLVLLAGLLLILYLFLKTSSVQVRQLSAHGVRYADVVFTQRQLGQQVDTIYRHLTLLNTGLIRSDRVLEQRIVHENAELYADLEKSHFKLGPHAVFYRISQGINEILMVKDSVRNAEGTSRSIRQELSDCRLRPPSTTK